MRMLVIGGGITGQLAQMVMPHAQIYDWGPPPEKRGAGLTRSFGTNYLWKPLAGIPCFPFPIITEVDGQPPTDASIRAYKAKIGKAYDQNWGTQFQPIQTGYDFLEPLDVNVTYNKRAVSINPATRVVVWSDGVVQSYDVLLSTIPLYALLAMLGSSDLGRACKDAAGGAFRYDPIYVKVTPIPPDAKYGLSETGMYVNYLSSSSVPVYRTCDRAGLRHYESLDQDGRIPTKKIVPGKIHPLPGDGARAVLALLQSADIYCFGRFAAWEPNELVHETYDNLWLFANERGAS